MGQADRTNRLAHTSVSHGQATHKIQSAPPSQKAQRVSPEHCFPAQSQQRAQQWQLSAGLPLYTLVFFYKTALKFRHIKSTNHKRQFHPWYSHMTESFLSRQYDLQISAPKLFIPKADEKPPPLQETSRLPAGTWLLMPLPTAQLKSFRNQTSNCKSLCRTNSSRQAVSAAGGSPFNWDLRVQMQNKDKILLWYHLSSWRLFISVEACYMTVPLFVTVVSLHLGFRTQLLLVQQKRKEYVVGKREGKSKSYFHLFLKF